MQFRCYSHIRDIRLILLTTKHHITITYVGKLYRISDTILQLNFWFNHVHNKISMTVNVSSGKKKIKIKGTYPSSHRHTLFLWTPLVSGFKWMIFWNGKPFFIINCLTTFHIHKLSTPQKYIFIVNKLLRSLKLIDWYVMNGIKCEKSRLDGT